MFGSLLAMTLVYVRRAMGARTTYFALLCSALLRACAFSARLAIDAALPFLVGSCLLPKVSLSGADESQHSWSHSADRPGKVADGEESGAHARDSAIAAGAQQDTGGTIAATPAGEGGMSAWPIGASGGVTSSRILAGMGASSAAGGTKTAPDDCSQCSAPYACTSEFLCRGQFADWPMPDAFTGAHMAPSYDTSNADTVKDNVTHLVWQRNLPALYSPICSGEYVTGGPMGEACIWVDASKYCANLMLAGHRWRLPTKIELESLQDDTRPMGMEKIDQAFPPTHSGYYWTSAPSVGEPGKHWAVDFDYGWSTGVDDGFRAQCAV